MALGLIDNRHDAVVLTGNAIRMVQIVVVLLTLALTVTNTVVAAFGWALLAVLAVQIVWDLVVRQWSERYSQA